MHSFLRRDPSLLSFRDANRRNFIHPNLTGAELVSAASSTPLGFTLHPQPHQVVSGEDPPAWRGHTLARSLVMDDGCAGLLETLACAHRPSTVLSFSLLSLFVLVCVLVRARACFCGCMCLYVRVRVRVFYCVLRLRDRSSRFRRTHRRPLTKTAATASTSTPF